MRRKDREVIRHADLLDMVARFKVCRLGLWDGREVYVVPLNFGYEERDGSLNLFSTAPGKGGSWISCKPARRSLLRWTGTMC